MCNILQMHIIKRVQKLLSYCPNIILKHCSVLCLSLFHQEVEEGAVNGKFRDDVVVFIIVKELIDLHDARMVELLKHFHFIL